MFESHIRFKRILVFNTSLFSGERGIRTPDTLRYNGFRDRPIQPLSHLSRNQYNRALSLSETKWVRTTGLQIRNLTLYPAEL
jgi:hypothetical protein